MPGAKAGLGRIVALGVALAMALLLLAARDASANKYTVAQCGWHIGADADWGDTTGGAKFRPDAFCATPPGADPFAGAHMKTFAKAAAGTVSGNRFGRWRWVAPPGTSITRISGSWWHALHDGLEQRIGAVVPAGFQPFAVAGATNVTPRNFVAGFSGPVTAIEDRLLCARATSRWCALNPESWSAIRAVTITLEDSWAPTAGIDGDLLAPGWRRGNQSARFWGSDLGSGVRFGETSIDGALVNRTEYICQKASIGGEWRGMRMAPCLPQVGGTMNLTTNQFSDGPHTLVHCSIDFAGTVGCTPVLTLHFDNNAPGRPHDLKVSGGEGWRRNDDFDLRWENPDQGPASPIAGARWRLVGPAGYDSGVHYAGGRDRRAIDDLRDPRPGTYVASVWLRDEAGNEAPARAASVALRFDDVAPGVAFEPTDDEVPSAVAAEVTDVHSGPASGGIAYRRLGSETWIDLEAKLGAPSGGRAELTARLPQDLAPGTYAFRAVGRDAAGNVADTTRRADGTEMAVRIVAGGETAPARVARVGGAAPAAQRRRGKTRVFAHLRWRHRRGASVTVPFGARAIVHGRLVDAQGAGIAGRRLRIVARPSRGALAKRRVRWVRSGRHGGFKLLLPHGPSRRVSVRFGGEATLSGSRRPALELRVRGGVFLAASPSRLRTGQRLRFHGRVRTKGAPVPRRGKLVAIQYYERKSRRWRPVLVTRTNHAGRFHASYRFRYVVGRARIRLRAVALAEERWPYAPGGSRPVLVRVSG